MQATEKFVEIINGLQEIRIAPYFYYAKYRINRKVEFIANC